jgi:hypothetical protein
MRPMQHKSDMISLRPTSGSFNNLDRRPWRWLHPQSVYQWIQASQQNQREDGDILAHIIGHSDLLWKRQGYDCGTVDQFLRLPDTVGRV